MVKVAALVAAAGQGKRMGAQGNKQFLSLAGRPVLARTLQVFEECPLVEGVIVISGPGEEEYCRREIIEAFGITKVREVLTGGPERQDSVYNGLMALPGDIEIVVIHDGARPLVTADLIEKSIREAQNHGAAVVAVKAKDTIKIGNLQGMVEGTPDRDLLWQVQTPQTFQLSLIKEAYNTARSKGVKGTDDAALVEALGKPVKLVPGSYENLKLTTPEDLAVAEAILGKRGEN